MKRFGKTLFTAALAGGISAFALPANASLLPADGLKYDELVTGATPASGSPWLTAEIADVYSGTVHTGVELTLNSLVTSPEFLTDLYFSLGSSADLSGVKDPSTSPDIRLETCNTSAKDPANTGPWQLCFSFAPKLHVADLQDFKFTLDGLFASDFVSNAAGWFSVAHIQGIQPNCSAWVGAYDGQGSVAPSSGYTCTSVPEPGTAIFKMSHSLRCSLAST